jgi:hypothetical protein
MTSKESRILYGELHRRGIAARESVHVTPLSVDILMDDTYLGTFRGLICWRAEAEH